MNYKRIHDQIIDKYRNKDRVGYMEKHHIILRCLGGTDDKENLVYLPPREHFLVHLLLFKMNKNTPHKYKYGMSLALFIHQGNNHIRTLNFKYSSRKYEIWHKAGLKCISEYRKGKMPVKDTATGKMIGEAEINHPKVLSGEWVHHSKGLKLSEQRKAEMRKLTKGSKNPNYKEFTDEVKEILYDCIKDSLEDNYLRVGILEKNFKQKTSHIFNKISNVAIINKYKSWQNLIDEYNEIFSTNVKYSRVFRSAGQRLEASVRASQQGKKC